MSVGGVDLDQRTNQTQESLMFGISGSPAQKRADLDRNPDTVWFLLVALENWLARVHLLDGSFVVFDLF